jgi:hypothetical protein
MNRPSPDTYDLVESVKCDRCGQPIVGESYDVWAFKSLYDEHNEPVKTGEPIDELDNTSDYFVFGNCCKEAVLREWHDMIAQLSLTRR